MRSCMLDLLDNHKGSAMKAAKFFACHLNLILILLHLLMT